MMTATLKDDFTFDEDKPDTEIRAFGNENFDLRETFCVCKGFETYVKKRKEL